MSKQGTFVIGKLKGYLEEPWKTDPTKFNRYIGVVVGTKNGGFNEGQEFIQKINVTMSEAERVVNECAALVGRDIIVEVGTASKTNTGDGRSWVEFFMLKTSKIEAFSG